MNSRYPVSIFLVLFVLLVQPMFVKASFGAVDGKGWHGGLGSGVSRDTEAELTITNPLRLLGAKKGFPRDDYFLMQRIRLPVYRALPNHVYTTRSSTALTISNTGSEPLEVQGIQCSDDYFFDWKIEQESELPFVLDPGESKNLQLRFKPNTLASAELVGTHTAQLRVMSDAGERVVTLAGIYQMEAEGNNELLLPEILEAFDIPVILPRYFDDTYPNASVSRARYGEIVMSELWEQADPELPVRMTILMVQSGKGAPSVKLFTGDKDAAEIIPSTKFRHAVKQVSESGDCSYYSQSVFPPLEPGDATPACILVEKVSGPFRYGVSKFTTSGTEQIDPVTGKSFKNMGVLSFQLRDSDHRLVPDVYVFALDYQWGKKSPGTNGDYNDCTVLVENIRPHGTPIVDLTDYASSAEERESLVSSQKKLVRERRVLGEHRIRIKLQERHWEALHRGESLFGPNSL